MKLIQERLNYRRTWSFPDVYLFTGNPIVKKNGALVMDSGAAKELQDSYPGLDLELGKLIKEGSSITRVTFLSIYPAQILGWFKVKDHWAEPAKLGIIAESVEALKYLADQNPDMKFHMNFPGIGNGKLDIKDVMPLLEALPDNVNIYL